MNQKGEITLTVVLMTLALTTLVLLCALELRHSFKTLEKRTTIFLCVKETKGEFHQFIKFMGRTNWGIKNINRVSLIMMFIPGLQGASMNAQKLKTTLKRAQDVRLISYLKTLRNLRTKSCPIDPRMLITPFRPARDNDGALKLREKQWTYYYLLRPYALSLEINLQDYESIHPRIQYKTEEKGAILFSLLSSR